MHQRFVWAQQHGVHQGACARPLPPLEMLPARLLAGLLLPAWQLSAAEEASEEAVPGAILVLTSGCTVPTASNFNSTAELDDGSCICDGAPCDPSQVQLPASVCPAATLTCMTCDSGARSCNYECVSEGGEECSAMMIESSKFKQEQQINAGLYLGICVCMIVLAVSSIVAHSLHRTWLQESMLQILLGVLLGLGLKIYAAVYGADSAGTQSAAALFEKHIAFDSSVFFYVLLPPIILVWPI